MEPGGGGGGEEGGGGGARSGFGIAEGGGRSGFGIAEGGGGGGRSGGGGTDDCGFSGSFSMAFVYNLAELPPWSRINRRRRRFLTPLFLTACNSSLSQSFSIAALEAAKTHSALNSSKTRCEK
jgi:hypothetical protein